MVARLRFVGLQIRVALCVVVSLSLGLSDCWAVEVRNLYEESVPVETREAPERAAAFKQALQSVLVRMTGNRGVLSHKEIEALVQNSSSYVQQYQYSEQQPVDSESSPAYLLWVRFDGAVLEEVLTQRGVSLWGKERPAVLVWMAVDTGGQRYLVGADTGEQAREAIRTVAEQRGIPAMYPLLDLQDHRQVSAGDIIGGFDEAVRQASKRYQPDVIAIARAKGFSDGFWQIHWRLYFGEQTFNWTSDGNLLSVALEEGMHELADALGERLRVQSASQGASEALLVVDGVYALEDYAKIENYLESLGQIRAYRPHRIERGKASYWLQFHGNSRDLEDVINLGDTLTKTIQAPLASQGNAASDRSAPLALHYQLQP